MSNNIKHNLNTKRLTEFTKDDTIYISKSEGGHSDLYFCKFISYDASKAVVCGEILEKPASWMRDSIVETQISARYDKCCLYGNATDEDDRSYYRWFDYSLYAMHPLEEHKVYENDVHVQKHPSYEMAMFSRSNYKCSLFGSNIQHNDIISLKISSAEHDRSNNNDYYHANRTLIEIKLSQSQFADLITSFNMGDGTPCTIDRFNGENYPDCPLKSKLDIFHSEFKKTMFNHTVDMKMVVEQAKDILENKNTIGKADREIILKGIDALMSKISSTVPFIANQFNESMENTVKSAKAEIEAFIENKIRSTGLETLISSEEKIKFIDLSNSK